MPVQSFLYSLPIFVGGIAIDGMVVAAVAAQVALDAELEDEVGSLDTIVDRAAAIYKVRYQVKCVLARSARISASRASLLFASSRPDPERDRCRAVTAAAPCSNRPLWRLRGAGSCRPCRRRSTIHGGGW